MKITKHTTYRTEVEGTTVNLTFCPVDHPAPLVAKTGDRIVLVYAVHDDHLEADDLGDGMGTLYGLSRHDKGRAQALAALGLDQYGEVDESLTPDKDAVHLDCYIHSGQRWSISGSGPRCRFDTARHAGVWVPDDCLRSQLDDEEKVGKDRRTQAVLYARQFLEQCNFIINGEVYGIVTEIFDEHGGFASCDHCWGYVGAEATGSEMKSQFEAACKDDGSCAAGGPKAQAEVGYVETSAGVTAQLYPGFTAWSGGECPVPGDVLVEVIFDGGLRGECTAANLYWQHIVPPFVNIIAYRVVK